MFSLDGPVLYIVFVTLRTIHMLQIGLLFEPYLNIVWQIHLTSVTSISIISHCSAFLKIASGQIVRRSLILSFLTRKADLVSVWKNVHILKSLLGY